jgi:lipopolysaccharide transport system permease protein
MELIIRPKNKWWQIDWKEIWLFRDLFYFLTWRDIKVKYKQTVVGVAWALFQPLVTMLVFTIFFGRFAGMPSEGVPYPIFVYTGLLFWLLFSSSLSHISNIFVENEAYRDESIFSSNHFAILIGTYERGRLCYCDGHFYRDDVLLWICAIGRRRTPVSGTSRTNDFSSVGIGLFLSSVNVKFRDVRFILPFFIQLLLFVTPVIYPVSIVSERFRWVMGLNPMSGVIDTARASMLGTGSIDWTLLGISSIMTILYCVVGYFYFKKVERYFADVI